MSDSPELGRASQSGGFGLFNMRERIHLLAGTMDVEITSGTRVTLRVPTLDATADG